MHEVRFHGRGGQGAVTSAEILAVAAIAEGKSAQAFPSFGPERRGAPVIAFARVASGPILNRAAIVRPTAVVVLDPSLLRLVPVALGLASGGVIVANTTKRDIRELVGSNTTIVTVDATRIAREELGRTITNTAMLGALLAARPIVDPASIEATLKHRLGRVAEANIRAFRRALAEAKVLEPPASAAGGAFRPAAAH